MHKTCFDGYLTEECQYCEYWHDGSDNSIGCGVPFPISNCEAFNKMEKEEEMKRKEVKNNGDYRNDKT